jgi:hypothetical protein
MLRVRPQEETKAPYVGAREFLGTGLDGGSGEPMEMVGRIEIGGHPTLSASSLGQDHERT